MKTSHVPSSFTCEYHDCCGALTAPGVVCGCPQDVPIVCLPENPQILHLVLRNGRLTRAEPNE